jgi:predicted transcriptional regulator
MRTKGSKKDFYQLSVRFSPEMGKRIQELATKHNRSFSKEVVHLVEAQLAQEKGVGSSDPQER